VVSTQEARRSVADELRAIGELLATRDLPLDLLTAAVAQLGATRTALAAVPERRRWYETGDEGEHAAEISRAYHDEHGPVRGFANPVAPPLVVQPVRRTAAGGPVEARARLGVLYEGPPRIVHGGWVAALFDEVLALVQRDAGVGGVTARLTVRYRRPTPVGAELELRSWIDDDQGRAVVAKATCHAEGELVAEAEAQFVRLPRRT